MFLFAREPKADRFRHLLFSSLSPLLYSGPDSWGCGPCPAQRTAAAPEPGVLPPEPHIPLGDVRPLGLELAAPQSLFGALSASTRYTKKNIMKVLKKNWETFNRTDWFRSILLPYWSACQGLWCQLLAQSLYLCSPAEERQRSVGPDAAGDPQTSVSNWSPIWERIPTNQSCCFSSACVHFKNWFPQNDAYQSEIFWHNSEYRSRGDANVGCHYPKLCIFCWIELQSLWRRHNIKMLQIGMQQETHIISFIWPCKPCMLSFLIKKFVIYALSWAD